MSTTFSKRDQDEAKAVVVAAKGFITPVQGVVKLDDLGKQLDKVTGLLDQLDKLRDELKDLVNQKNDEGRKLNVMVRKFRDETGTQFGYDSSEYEMVGRKRTSERKRPVRTNTPNT